MSANTADNKDHQPATPPTAPPPIQRFTAAQLAAATSNFSRAHEVGHGFSGHCFAATLPVADDATGRRTVPTRVCIKKFRRQPLVNYDDDVLFRPELDALTRVHRLNNPTLLQLLGYCDDELPVERRVRDASNGPGTSTTVTTTESCKCLVFKFLTVVDVTNVRMGGRLESLLLLARAVHQIHQLGLIHQDIAVKNIFLDITTTTEVRRVADGDGGMTTKAVPVTTCTTILGDFGAARPPSPGELVLCSRGFFPPETTDKNTDEPRPGIQPTVAVDVFCLGLTFVCFRLGLLQPWPASVLKRHWTRMLPRARLEELLRELAQEHAPLAALCASMLNSVPEERPALPQVIAALERMLRTNDNNDASVAAGGANSVAGAGAAGGSPL